MGSRHMVFHLMAVWAVWEGMDLTLLLIAVSEGVGAMAWAWEWAVMVWEDTVLVAWAHQAR